MFDGVGDLEHVIHMTHHLLTLRNTETFKVVVFLMRTEAVPEIAWRVKLEELSNLEIGDIHVTLEDIDSDSNKCQKIKFQELKKSAPPTTDFCEISVSTFMPLSTLQPSGFVTEYMSQPKLSELHFLRCLNLGLFSKTAGIWIEDDPVFNEKHPPLSDSLKKILFGSILSDKKQKTWEVGFASLREDRARLIWITIRLHQLKKASNCTLSLSSFTDSELEQKKIKFLATQYNFDTCVIVDKNGVEKRIASSKGPPTRTLRIVHPFIPENDLPALIQKAGEGTLGGAGDTSCIRGLLGEWPLFVEVRDSTEGRWQEAIAFFKEKKFLELATWFQDCLEKNYYNLVGRLTPELAKEWQEFRSRAREELEAAPWVTRYLRRCALVTSKNGEKILEFEKDYLREKINISDYNRAIEHFIP